MTDLADKARRDGPEVVLPAAQPQEPPVVPVSGALYSPDELTPEGRFPQYGDFIEMAVWDPDEQTVRDDHRYWSTPKALADVLIETAEEHEMEPSGLVVDVDSVHKTPTGEWRYVVAVAPQ